MSLAQSLTSRSTLPRYTGLGLVAWFGGGGGSGGGLGYGGGGGGGGGDGGNPQGSSQQDFNLTDAERERKKREANPTVSLTLVSFAVSRKAYQKITDQFMKQYKEQTGQRVRFRFSFGGSGSQARAVCDGLPAEIVALALPLDVQRISDDGLISPGWEDRLPNGANVVRSHVAIVTRAGNPKNITGWEDLARDGVEVVCANPKTAGVARWNFLALWGHKLHKGPEAAHAFVKKVFMNVPVQPRDSREASDVFYKQKRGDCLLNYENEVIATNESYGPEEALPYMVPHNNIQINMPVALVDGNLKGQRPEVKEAAEAFLQYLFTAPAQQIFLECGFRSVDDSLQKRSKYPRIRNVWTVEDLLGGWNATQKEFFDEGGICDRIMGAVGLEQQELRRSRR